MSSNKTSPGQPQVAHPQPIDPAAQVLEGNEDQHRLQEVLPEIKDLAQKVGGMKQLAEIAETLDQTKED